MGSSKSLKIPAFLSQSANWKKIITNLISPKRWELSNVNGIIQKFEISRLFEEIRFVIIFFQFADWLKKVGIFKLLEDPIYS